MYDLYFAFEYNKLHDEYLAQYEVLKNCQKLMIFMISNFEKWFNMERIVYVQDDHFEIPEDLLKLSHEELRERINEERKKEIEKKKRQLAKLEKSIS